MENQGDKTSAGEGAATPTSGERRDPPIKQGGPHENPEYLLEVDLTDLHKTLLKPSHARLGVLKGHNYDTWAQTHKKFLRGRGIWGIVSGSLPHPTTSREAQNWMILDQWVVT